MELSAYSPARLQDALGLLALAAEAGLDLPGLRAMVAERLTAALPPVDDSPRTVAIGPRICPSCGRGPLTPVRNRDGLHIMGCRLCRYSEVI